MLAPKSSFSRAAWVAAGAALAGSLFVAQPAAAAQPGVARLSTMSGPVAIRHGGAGQSLGAVANAPVAAGDELATGRAGRAEVQYDAGNFIRLASDSQVRFPTIAAGQRVAQLAAGTADVRILRATNARPEIETPSVAIRPARLGSYRVTVRRDGSTLLTVRSGQAFLLLPHRIQAVEPGSTWLIAGPLANPRIAPFATVGYDPFDSWNAERDSFDGNGYGERYVANVIPGIADLAQYGRWVNDPRYGESWIPSNVPANWAPYQNGQWVWEPNYGYTWVGNEPWGYAPYHYGNWYDGNNGWAWQPTSNDGMATWLPAVVSFLGFGNSSSTPELLGTALSAFSNIGWVPLAPGEPYYPWSNGYAYSGYAPNGYYPPPAPTYVTNNDYTTYNYTRIVRIYRNFTVPGAVAMVPAASFADGNVTRIVRVNVTDRTTIEDLRKIVVIRNVVPAVPSAAALRFTRDSSAEVTGLGSSTAFRQFPALPQSPQPFDEQRARLASVIARSVKASPALRPAPVIESRDAARPNREAPASAFERPVATSRQFERIMAGPRQFERRPAAPRAFEPRRAQFRAIRPAARMTTSRNRSAAPARPAERERVARSERSRG